MNRPVQITFRDVDPSASVRERIQARSAELPQEVVSCHVTIAKTQRPEAAFQLRVDAHIPRDTLLIEREGSDVHALVDATMSELGRRVHAHVDRIVSKRHAQS